MAFQQNSFAGEPGLVTLAMHIGRAGNRPLLENLIRSFEVCNEYPDVEIMLLETGGNSELREWLDALEVQGASKRTAFLNFGPMVPWYRCYMSALDHAVKNARGEYFVFMAEDNQFTVKGNVIGRYIDLLSEAGDDRTIVHFFSQQGYKYAKPNNRFGGLVDLQTHPCVRPNNMKWCPFALCKRSVYQSLMPLQMPDSNDPHRTINSCSARARELGYQRLYPIVPAGVWFPNDACEIARSALRAGELNDDGLLLSCYDLDDLLERKKGTTFPMSSEDFWR